MAVPYTFGSATSAIPLSQLDSNFATTITLGNTAIQLGNTVTTLNNMTLANVTVTTVSGASANAVVYTNSSGQVTANSSVIALDTSGNLGLGVTPSASTSNYRTFQIGTSGNSFGIFGQRVAGASETFLGWNAYGGSNTTSLGSGFYYRNTGDLASLYTQNGSHTWFTAASGTAGNAITFTQAMTLDASSRLMLGTTSALGNLTIGDGSGSTSVFSYLNAGTGGGALIGRISNSPTWFLGDTTAAIGSGTGMVNYVYGSNPWIVYTAGNERARIDSSGNLLVGTTNTSETTGVGAKIITSNNTSFKIVTNGTTNLSGSFFSYSAGAGAYRFYVTDDGVINATSTTITAISDQRLKENVRTLDVGLSEIMSLQPRRFDWKDGKGLNKKDDVGFIAQEFETVFPNSVTKSLAGEDGIEYKAINQSELIPTLVKAIQEQQAIITQLQADVAALKGTK